MANKYVYNNLYTVTSLLWFLGQERSFVEKTDFNSVGNGPNLNPNIEFPFRGPCRYKDVDNVTSFRGYGFDFLTTTRKTSKYCCIHQEKLLSYSWCTASKIQFC